VCSTSSWTHCTMRAMCWGFSMHKLMKSSYSPVRNVIRASCHSKQTDTLRSYEPQSSKAEEMGMLKN
jgi:hypothetical protein